MFRVLVLASAVLMLQACVSVRSQHGYVLERDQTELTATPGLDTQESVLAKYGEPSLIGTFDDKAWYYLNSRDQSRAFFRPKTQARTVIAFYFNEDGSVRETDEFTLEDGENIKLVSRTTPSRGRELNFWEQLLGTVGQLPAGIGNQQVPGQ
ncbi:MAG: outer membrane protein assembly factor BamE [Marinicaulis sp.]|nr:outer membrane protein assembly factor BamE [Marinicaulis sp.]NNE40502.1 outer membrane protein assembly factor BamE [Marinicaulis sp.]NNL89542.1 outer membrane protein assembly factor BamE [Marinicaulis sp.]